MKLKFKIKDLNDVAEAFRGLYTQQADGSYQLDVEGAADKSVLDEFRNKNIDLLKEAEKFKDLNPAKYQELLKLDEQRKEKELLDAGEVEQVVANRVKAMKAEMEGTINTLTSANQVANKQLEVLMIDNSVRDVAIKSGVRPEAVDDVMLRAKTVFSIKDGKVQAVDNEGKVIYGTDGQSPLGIGDWAKGLKTTAPHLFMGSNGGGANGNSGRSPASQNRDARSKIAAGLEAGQMDN